jgi:hypothetical protein
MSGGNTSGGRVYDPRAATLPEPPRRSSQTISFERVIVPKEQPPPASAPLPPSQDVEFTVEIDIEIDVVPDAEPDARAGRYSFVDLGVRRPRRA